MKERPDGFIDADKIDHDGEIFDYIRELHDYLWRVVHVVYPGASGILRNEIDDAIMTLEERAVIDDPLMITVKVSEVLQLTRLLGSIEAPTVTFCIDNPVGMAKEATEQMVQYARAGLEIIYRWTHLE